MSKPVNDKNVSNEIEAIFQTASIIYTAEFLESVKSYKYHVKE